MTQVTSLYLGSTFTVRLPATAVPPVPLPGEPAPEAAADTNACRILVVDDHPDVRESLVMLLELQGHEVVTASDGLEAVEAAARRRPDLVLLDLGMPRLDGYGACSRIREQAWGRELTIVALTGWGQDGDRRQTREAGFDDHLVKPVPPSAPLDLVARLRPRGSCPGSAAGGRAFLHPVPTLYAPFASSAARRPSTIWSKVVISFSRSSGIWTSKRSSTS